MPSMSHSAFVTRSITERTAATKTKAGWWEDVVNESEQAGINLNKFRVISASPMGGPYGTTSPLSVNPLTGQQYRSSFPIITPLDQARVHAMLLDHLGIAKVHAIVGASMGGMQVLQFAVHYPARYDRVIAICTTGQTMPSTQALRSVQRAAVRMDPHFHDGNYADDATGQSGGPIAGMGIARMFGTICYRSRAEFDARFSNRMLTHQQREQPSASTPSSSSSSSASSSSPSPSPLFEVEKYLFHQASTFTGRYDANCYLTLSQCMDLMDLATPTPQQSGTNQSRLTYEQACQSIPASKQFLLLPIASDALIPAEEMERLGRYSWKKTSERCLPTTGYSSLFVLILILHRSFLSYV